MIVFHSNYKIGVEGEKNKAVEELNQVKVQLETCNQGNNVLVCNC